MGEKTPSQLSTPLALDLGVKHEGVFNEIEMGVLENGIPYLTQRGLAKICGVHRTNIADVANEYTKSFQHGFFAKGRMEFISSHLQQIGYTEPNLFISVMKNGSLHHAFPDVVCMAILEFYTFESQNASNTTAKQYYRDLARVGLRDYIYSALHYQPDDPWRHYHERVSIIQSTGAIPDGYFIVFNEIAGLMVDLIQAGLVVNMYTVPDISVGQCWGAHWSTAELGRAFGERTQCNHNYPDNFNQSSSNPQTINAYPNAALPEFRRWFRHEYLQTKFPKYILGKSGMLPRGRVDALRITNALKNHGSEQHLAARK